MKRILAVLVMGMAATRADGPGGQPVIEKSTVNDAAPLDAADLQRMAAGMPPRVRSMLTLSAELCSGWFICICPKCGDHANRGVPRLRLLTDCQTPFTVAEVVKPFEAQGARFVRGTDGAIVQAATTKDCSFVSSAKGVITVERYHTPDCRTDADGRMQPLPDAVRQSRVEIRELTDGPGKGLRSFEVKGTEEPGGEFLMTMEHRERKGQSQVVTTMFRGHETKPEAMVSRGFLQRVTWPEGPGYRQIRKVEAADPDGEMKVTEHVVESWHVAPDGSRKLVEKQELVAPAKPAEEAPHDDTEDFH